MKYILIAIIIMSLALIPNVSAYRIVQKIDIVNGLASTTSTSWAPTDGSTGIIHLNLSKYDFINGIYYEVTADYDYLGIPNGIGSGQAGLYDMTNGNIIDDSIVSLAGGSDVVTSGNLTYLFGNETIEITPSMKAGTNSQVNLNGARLVIVQDGEINRTRTYIPMGQSRGTTSNCVGGGADPETIYPKRWAWNESDYNGDVNITHAGTIYRAGGMFGTRVAYANIANTTVDVPNSQIQTTNTVPTFVTTGNIIELQDGKAYNETLCKSLFATNAIQKNAFIVVDQINIPGDPYITIPYQMENTQRVYSGISPAIIDTQRVYWNGSWGSQLAKVYAYDSTFKTQSFTGTEIALSRGTIGITAMTASVVITTSTTAHNVRRIFDFTSYESTQAPLSSAIWNLDAAADTVIWSGRLIVHVRGRSAEVPEVTCWTYNNATQELFIPNGCEFFTIGWIV